MKKIKVYMAFLAVFALLLTSCSKDDGAVGEKEDLATLSFTTVLNDLVANKASVKQQLEIPACSDDAPAFVAVVLTGETNIGTVEDPVIVSVNPNPDNFDDDPEEEYFTEESADLELVPGEYTLEYFAVYNGNPDEEGTEVIWVAPREDGELANFVDTSLPFTFDIGPGAKKYVDVEVLCFDDRIVNEYGYLFFELETTNAIEFCVFGNFCDQNGRHYPAAYEISIWEYNDESRGDIIHDNISSSVTQNEDGDYSADPVCVALPDTAGEDEYYVEITLLDSDQYNTSERVIREGVITDEQVRTLFNGDDNVDYYHFREGNCDSEDGPNLFLPSGGEPPEEGNDVDEDEIIDEEDNCPEIANTDQSDLDNDGVGDVCDADLDGDSIPNSEDTCPDVNPETDTNEDGCEDTVEETDADSDGTPDEEDNCPEIANSEQEDLDEDGIGDACDSDIDGDGIDNDQDDCPVENPTTDADGDGCEDEAEPDTDTDSDTIPDEIDNCPNVANTNQEDQDQDGIGDVCDPDLDGDGFDNDLDECPDTNPITDENNDGCEDIVSNTCSIDPPAAECSVGYFEGVDGFVEVTDNVPLDLRVNGEFVGTVTATITADGSLDVVSELTAQGGFLYSAVEVWVSSESSGEEILSQCLTDLTTGNFSADFGDINASYPYYIRVKANVCPANVTE